MATMIVLALILSLVIEASSFTAFRPFIRRLAYRFQYSHAMAVGTDTEAIVLNVPKDLPPCRLDVFISQQIEQQTRSAIGNLCDQRKVTVNGNPKSKSYKVREGDRIQFVIESSDITNVEAEDIPLDIIYEDDHIIAVNKAIGMVVHPAVGSPNGTFVNALLYHLGAEKSQLLFEAAAGSNTERRESGAIDLPETPEAAKATPSSARPGIVHRLDKGTSGVLLAGKTPFAVSQLSKLFAERTVTKIYVAVCVGHPGETSIFQPIGRSQKNRQLMCTYEGPPGKPAITHLRTISFDGAISVCLLRIETGRTHQIRVHLKERRTPVLGDDAYGNKDWNKRYLRSEGIRRPLLHAYETSFIHPLTGKSITVRAPLPEDMRKITTKMIQRSTAAASYLGEGVVANILDDETGLLQCSTEVSGRGMINLDSNSAQSLIISSSGKNDFVPLDRLLIDEEEDWLSYDLPETDDFLHS